MEKLTVGIEVVPSVAFGRAFVKGVSRYAIEQKNWRLVALQQETLSIETLRKCDGAIMRIFDDKTEKTIRAAGIPIVDVFCAKPQSGIAQVSTNEEAEQIFRLSGFSPPYVEKVFKAKLGCTVQAYITNMRMKMASTLLRDSKMSVKEVAAACGFASPQYFCRVFKSHFGTSSQKYAGLSGSVEE